MVRKQFPFKEGQTYFNNGAMVSDLRLCSRENDYKDGSGPELLSGYFKCDFFREKIRKIINANDLKEISITQNITFGMNYVGMA